MLLAGNILTIINTSVVPGLFTSTMLEVVFPVAFVGSTINVIIYALAISLIIDPVSLVNIAIDVSELASAVSSVVLPSSFVLSTVWPLLLAKTISEATNPFSIVSSPSLELINWAPFSFGIWIIHAVLNSLP